METQCFVVPDTNIAAENPHDENFTNNDQM